MRSVVQSAVEAGLREKQKQEQENFYKLVLSETDLSEIKKLREIVSCLREPEALNKAIWTVYYQKPYTDLIGRVFGTSKPCGIYKITNQLNGMTYVGQAVNVPERWRTHIKRGIGAEAGGRNKLYPAMLSFGIENFTFELVEECDRNQLDEREDFWQDYFQSKIYGYSIK